jgi:hypothetical protein
MSSEHGVLANNTFSAGIPLRYLGATSGSAVIGIEFLQPAYCAQTTDIDFGIAFASGCSRHRRFRLQLFAKGASNPKPLTKDAGLFAADIAGMLDGKNKHMFEYVSGSVAKMTISGRKVKYSLTRGVLDRKPFHPLLGTGR